jgi:hypothetical protein
MEWGVGSLSVSTLPWYVHGEEEEEGVQGLGFLLQRQSRDPPPYMGRGPGGSLVLGCSLQLIPC